MSLNLGIDIGGTNTKIALVAGGGRIIKKAVIKTESGQGFDFFAKRLKARLLIFQPDRVESIGIGIAGIVNPETEVADFCVNLKWKKPDIKKKLKGFHKNIFIANDAQCACLAAYVTEGRKRKADNIITLTLGTGVGGGLIIGGRLYTGNHGIAGEIGHMPLWPGGRRCVCGRRGCVEAYLGTKGILATAREMIENNRPARACLSGNKTENLSTEIISRAALKKDRIAIGIYDRVGQHLGFALSACINIIDPDLIVLAGGVANAGNLLLEPARRLIKNQGLNCPEIIISKNPGDLGVIGAAMLGNHFFNRYETHIK